MPYKLGSGKTGRANPKNKKYSPKYSPSDICLPHWAKDIISRHARAAHKSNAQFVCEWAERLERRSPAPLIQDPDQNKLNPNNDPLLSALESI